MKLLGFLSLLLCVGMMTCSAQQIETKKVFGGYEYSQNGKSLTINQMVTAVENNQQALELMKKARSGDSISQVLAFIGGGLIGWPLGTAVAGGDANWTLAGIGAGVVVVAIPISSSAHKKAKQAVDLYNDGLNSTSLYENPARYDIIANGNGLGLSIRF